MSNVPWQIYDIDNLKLIIYLFHFIYYSVEYFMIILLEKNSRMNYPRGLDKYLDGEDIADICR